MVAWSFKVVHTNDIVRELCVYSQKAVIDQHERYTAGLGAHMMNGILRYEGDFLLGKHGPFIH